MSNKAILKAIRGVIALSPNEENELVSALEAATSTKQPSDEAKEIPQRVNALPADVQSAPADIVSAVGRVSHSAENGGGTVSNNKSATAARIEAQRQCVFEIGAIISVVNQTLNAFSGDEDSLDIVEKLSTQCYALEAAYRQSNQIAQELELIGEVFKSDTLAVPTTDAVPSFPFNVDAQVELNKAYDLSENVHKAAESISLESVGAPESLPRLHKAVSLLEEALGLLEAVNDDPQEQQRWDAWSAIYDDRNKPETYHKSPHTWKGFSPS